MKTSRPAALSLSVSMLIFGSVGLIRNLIPLPSGAIAMLRGLIGALCLVPFLRKRREGLSATLRERKTMLMTLLSGVLLGFNWMLLFEAYRYTSVAIATLSYYMAPVFVILALPSITRTRLTPRQWLCAVTAVCGMVLLSDVLTDTAGVGKLKGVLLGLGAACLYAAIILISRFFPAKDAFAGTVIRVGTAGIVLIPYVLTAEPVSFEGMSLMTLLLLAVICVIHTGLAYLLYFGAVGSLSPLTTALMSYIDPVTAVLLSALILKEALGPVTVIGAVLLLGAVIILELPAKRSVNPRKE